MKKSKPRKPRAFKREITVKNTFVTVQVYAVICYVAFFLIGAFIALAVDLPSKYDYIYSLSLFAVSSLLTGFFAGMKLREKGLVVGVLYTLPLNAIITLISLVFSDFSVGINFAVTVTVLVISGSIGGILAVNKRLSR